MRKTLIPEDLGELKPCECCGMPTFHKESKPLESQWQPGTGQMLPMIENWRIGESDADSVDVQLNNSHYRMYIWFKGKVTTLCTRCRYSAPYEGY